MADREKAKAKTAERAKGGLRACDWGCRALNAIEILAAANVRGGGVAGARPAAPVPPGEYGISRLTRAAA